MSDYIDMRRCSDCEKVFGRSRFMVRRGTTRCRTCAQKAVGRDSDHFRALALKSHEVRTANRTARLAALLANLSQLEAYELGIKHEFNRRRYQRLKQRKVA
jgi:hypothetical protein